MGGGKRVEWGLEHEYGRGEGFGIMIFLISSPSPPFFLMSFIFFFFLCKYNLASKYSFRFPNPLNSSVLTLSNLTLPPPRSPHFINFLFSLSLFLTPIFRLPAPLRATTHTFQQNIKIPSYHFISPLPLPPQKRSKAENRREGGEEQKPNSS